MWRKILGLTIIWLLIEGVIRKIIPGQPVWILLIKDIMIFATYCAYLLSGPCIDFRGIRPWENSNLLYVITFLFIGVCIYGCFIGDLFSFELIYIGLRGYLFYVPLVFIGYWLFRSASQMYQTFFWLMLLIIVPTTFALLEVVANKTGASLPLGIGVIDAYGRAHTADNGVVYYAAGTFDVAERLASMAFLFYSVGIGLIPHEQGKRKIVIVILTLMSLFCVIVSARRTGLFAAITGTFLLLPFLINPRHIKQLILICTILTFSMVLLNYFYPDPFILASITTEDELIHRSKNLDIEMILSTKGHFWGHGIGVKTQGAQYVAGAEELANDYPYKMGWIEGLFPKVIYELGAIGGFIYLGWLGYVAFFLSKYSRPDIAKIKLLTFALYTTIILTILWSLKGHQILGDGHTLFRFWLAAGIILGTSRFEPDLEECNEVVPASQDRAWRFAPAGYRSLPASQKDVFSDRG